MQSKIEHVVQSLYGIEEAPFDIRRNEEAKFGVFATNVAFIVSRTIKRDPEAIAEEITKALRMEEHVFEAVATNGHINLHLPDEVHVASYVDMGKATGKIDPYFVYRVHFLYERLSQECRRLDRVNLKSIGIDKFFVFFFIYGDLEQGAQAFKVFDQEMDYSKYNAYEKNILFTILSQVIDKLNKSA